MKYLSTPKFGFDATMVDDIGGVDTKDEAAGCSSKLEVTNVEGAEVVGVESINHYRSCIECQGKVDDVDGMIGVCCKCSMKERLDRCVSNMSSRLLICAGSKQFYMTAFENAIDQIVQTNEEMSEEDIISQLLMSEPFKFTFTVNNIITDVSRAD